MHIGELLREVKCCLRCCNRFLGKHSRVNYAIGRTSHNNEQEEVAPGSELTQTPNKDDNTGNCPVCLGILGETFMSSCIDQISKKVLEQSYDNESFSLNAMIPNSITVRQHSLFTYVKEKFSGGIWQQEHVVSVKDALKYGLAEKVEERTKKRCDVKSDLRITVVADYVNEQKEVSALMKTSRESNSRKRKSNGAPLQSIPRIQSMLDELNSVETLATLTECPPQVPTQQCTLKDVLCFQEATYVAGRYNKYSRELSQTPWIIDGVRKTETSVQELICEKIVQFFRAQDLKFISAGREDVDVKMLGSGRPFAVELVNSKRTKASEEEMKTLQASINGSTDIIAVNRLQLISKKDLILLKQGEEQKTKFYRSAQQCKMNSNWPYFFVALFRATVFAKNGVSDEKLASLEKIKDLSISQKTPIRVLHRRPFAARGKTIHSIFAERIDHHHFTLSLSTQAGTYIKEFVHGDFKRTSPSLGSLLETEVDILDLDVQEVELEWPPSRDEAKAC